MIPAVEKQFRIVKFFFSNREDVDTIYVCTDSGREGEYIYRLVEQEAHVTGKKRRAGMDRFPDRGGNSKRYPGGKRSVRL